MERTKSRPLPAGLIAPRAALVFGLGLGVLSTVLLAMVSGPAAALVGVASILFYVFVYTIWLKPRSIWNAVIGGAAGAAAPLIADAAVNGTIGLAGWTLFAIVFFWQPPHVWAIALYRKADYRAAGIPMPPEVIGDEATRRRIVWYTAGLLPVTVAPYFLGLTGPIYFVGRGGDGPLVPVPLLATLRGAHRRSRPGRLPRLAGLPVRRLPGAAGGSDGAALVGRSKPIRVVPDAQLALRRPATFRIDSVRIRLPFAPASGPGAARAALGGIARV